MTVALQEIPLDHIRPSPHNPRIIHDKDPELASLAASIAEVGVLHPVLVRPVHDVNGAGEAFELIAGERRWRAAKLAGIAAIAATVRTDLTEQQALELTVTENLQREDLHPLEEAKGVASLLGEGHDYRAVADRLGKSLGWVARRARLALLSPTWRKLIANPKSAISAWPAAMLELVARLDPKAQDAFWQAHQWLGDEHRTENARDLASRLADWTLDLSLAPWKLDDDTLDPQAGACATCPKRSSCTPGLFDDDLEPKKATSGDRCLDALCWERKAERHLARVAAKLEQEHGKLVFAGYVRHGEKAPAFTKGAPLVDSWAGTPAKKGDKGAVPVLYVTGEKRGKVEWKRFGRESSPKEKKAAAGSKPVVKSLAERRKMLEGRRAAHSLEAICDAVEKAFPPSESDLLKLLYAFGTRSNASRPGTMFDGYEHVKPTTLLKSGRVTSGLWESVADVLTKRWKSALSWHGQKGLAEHQEEIDAVAAMVKLDLAPFAQQAAEAIPEPKSWAKLAETEKAAKKSAKPKGQAKAKPKGKAERAS